MNKTQILLLVSFSMVVLMLAACGNAETPTAAEPTPQPATKVPTEAPTEKPAKLQIVPKSEIQNIEWQWIKTIGIEELAMPAVPNPENYTLALFEGDIGGTFFIRADCNTGSGRYGRPKDKIQFSDTARTMETCPSGSLDLQFLRSLAYVDHFRMLDGDLVLVFKNVSGKMHFQNGGPAEKPTPAP